MVSLRLPVFFFFFKDLKGYWFNFKGCINTVKCVALFSDSVRLCSNVATNVKCNRVYICSYTLTGSVISTRKYRVLSNKSSLDSTIYHLNALAPRIIPCQASLKCCGVLTRMMKDFISSWSLATLFDWRIQIILGIALAASDNQTLFFSCVQVFDNYVPLRYL